MKKEKTLFVGINYRFGSKFQEETALEMLAVMLYAWKKQIESQHKGNSVGMTFTPDGILKDFADKRKE